MGWNRHRLGLLNIFAFTAITACDEVDREPPPVWTPWDQVNGVFQPELEQAPTLRAPPSNLRLVSFNVLRGIEIQDVELFLSEPDLASADVIALQESVRRSVDDESDAGQLASRLQMGHVFVPIYEADGELNGLAFLSRFPLVDVQVMRLPDEADADVLIPTARAALRATIETTSGPVQMINVHLDVGLNVPERVLQLRPAVIDIPTRVAVLGDFNTNDYVWVADTVPILPLDAVAATSQADAIDGYMQAIGYDTPMAKLGSTWHGFPEDQRLDSIFTRGMVPGRRAVERDLNTSDHWPIWLDVSVGP
jgi:endonuclease/exonuclease/phosphatase family metal-dependent hydrolase